MEHDFDLRIQAYLNDELSAADRASFEAELRANPALQRELRRNEVLEKAIAAHGPRRLREMGREVREKFGPLPEPTLTWRDRLRYLDGWRTVIWVVGGLLLFLAGLLWYANSGTLTSPQDFVAQYFTEPKCLGVAGQSPAAGLPERREFEKASGFYCGKTIRADSLRLQQAACRSFCMAEYYLAHYDLLNGRYEQSAAGFRKSLDNAPYILQFREMQPEIPHIKLNWILARLAAGQRPAEVLPDLEALLRDTASPLEVHKKAEALRRELN